MKKLTLALFVVVAGCAAHKPCAVIPPPFVDKMKCAIDPRSDEETIGLICETPSVQKTFHQIDELQKWSAEVWGACSK